MSLLRSVLACCLLLTAPFAGAAEPADVTISELLPRLGHRNWIAVVDSAYPAQVSPGIRMEVVDADHLETVSALLDAVEAAPHVRGIVHVDAELAALDDELAEGVNAFKNELDALLANQDVRRVPHEQIIARLDEAGQTFSVVLIKTPLTIPYTSVFVELDCGYWSPESEAALRARMAK